MKVGDLIKFKTTNVVGQIVEEKWSDYEGKLFKVFAFQTNIPVCTFGADHLDRAAKVISKAHKE